MTHQLPCTMLLYLFYAVFPQIPKLKPHREAPATTFKEPTEQEFLAKVKETNRRKAEVRHLANV